MRLRNSYKNIIQKFQPENRFLLYFLTGNDSFLHHVQQPDEQKLIQTLKRHRLIPAAYRIIKESASVDPDAQNEGHPSHEKKPFNEGTSLQEDKPSKHWNSFYGKNLSKHKPLFDEVKISKHGYPCHENINSRQRLSFSEKHLSAEFQGKLKEEYLDITKKSLKNLNALIQVSHILRDHDIPFLCMKGLPLAKDIYQNYTERPSVDIDLLIDEKNQKRAHEILLDAGFRLSEDLKDFTPKQLRQFTHVKHSFDYYNPALRAGLELHWQTFNTKALFPYSFDEFYKSRVLINIDNQVFDTFHPLYNFIYLCLHGSVHGYYRLFWLQDVFLYYKKYQYKIDWEKFNKIIRKNRLERPVGQSLLLINQIYGIPLPEHLAKILMPQPFSPTSHENRIEKEHKHPSSKMNYILNKQFTDDLLIRIPRKDDKIRYYLNTALKSINEPEKKLKTRKLGRLRRFYYLLCLKPDLTYKKQILTSLFVFPKDWQKIQLPDRLFFVYYLIRPITWFWDSYIRSSKHR